MNRSYKLFSRVLPYQRRIMKSTISSVLLFWKCRIEMETKSCKERKDKRKKEKFQKEIVKIAVVLQPVLSISTFYTDAFLLLSLLPFKWS